MHHSQPCQNWEQTVPTIWIGLSELNFAELSDLKKPKQETSFPPLTPGSLQCWDRCCSNDGEETCGNAVREIKLQKSRNQRNQADVLAVTCLQGRLGGLPAVLSSPSCLYLRQKCYYGRLRTCSMPPCPTKTSCQPAGKGCTTGCPSIVTPAMKTYTERKHTHLS